MDRAHPTRTLAGLAALVAALVVVVHARVAGGQVERMPETRPPLAELIERLGSPVFAAREQATRDLLNRRDFTLDEAELQLATRDLAPEQLLRLERVALEVFARGPRAALGISFPPEGSGGVRIQSVVPGFPASHLLMAGDRITSADGLAITRQATFRAVILSHAPEEVMRITLVRAGETSALEVPLGSFAQLASAASPRPGDLLAAWTLRRARETPRESGTPIVPQQIDDADQPDAPAPGSAAWASVYTTPDAPRSIRVGGQPRESIDLSLLLLTAMDASRALTLEDLQAEGPVDLAVQVKLLQSRRDLILTDIERITAFIEGGNLDGSARAMMRRRLGDERQRLLVLEQQIRMLDERRREEP